MNKKAVAIIPARLGSRRLKEKPLALISGKTLINRVYERAAKLKNVVDTAVAVDSVEVKKEVEGFGGRAIMTPSNLGSGSERVFHVAAKYYSDVDVVVNIQGDEPFFNAEFVDSLIELSFMSEEGLVSGYTEIRKEQASDTSVVKVVLDENDYAIYFSRSLIPHGAETYKKHLGIYVWSREVLENFCRSGSTPLEKAESLEQLRVLEKGGEIKMMRCISDSPGIDTPEDLKKAEKYILSMKDNG